MDAGRPRMVCYTRNFEDVILQRVFADVPQGHYIDVGASMPVVDSNTYALYTKGWRGVAIEPQDWVEAWKSARPGDRMLRAVAGSQRGRRVIRLFDGALQGSSGDSATVEHVRKLGYESTQAIDAPMLPLDEVVAQHLPGKPLHLLSIDVEGMEHEVLQGLDLELHRPWVIVVEAVLPATAAPAHERWEPMLLDAGYHMAYFDGVNRFYLAHEQRHLLGRFALPPNVWDGFVMATEQSLRARIAQLEDELRRLGGK